MYPGTSPWTSYEPGGITGNPTATAAPQNSPQQFALSGWQSVQQGDYGRAFLDWATQQYGQAGRGSGFANLDPNGLQSALNGFYNATGVRGVIAPGKGDQVSFNGGAPIDVVTAIGTPGSTYWNGSVAGAGAPGGAGAGAGGGNGLPVTGAPGSGSLNLTGSAGGLGFNDPNVQQLYQLLLGRATQGLALDPNSPEIAGPTQAYAAEQERSRRNYLSQLAESSNPNANLTTEERLTAETAGQNTSGYQANLIAQQMQARRTEIQQALSEMGSVLTSQQQLALQTELAQLDNALQQSRLTEQGREFDKNLGYEYDAPQLQWEFGSAF